MVYTHEITTIFLIHVYTHYTFVVNSCTGTIFQFYIPNYTLINRINDKKFEKKTFGDYRFVPMLKNKY